MAIYETFIINDLSDLKDGEEQILQIRDVENYETRLVKAIISSSPEKLPGADALRVRWQRGQPEKKLWAIKITQELGGVFDNLGIKY
jgi:hypothetical protein